MAGTHEERRDAKRQPCAAPSAVRDAWEQGTLLHSARSLQQNWAPAARCLAFAWLVN